MVENILAAVKKQKRTLIIVGVTIVFIILFLSSLFVKGYMSAKSRYEETIAELEKEVEKLSDPIAKYEVASKEIDIDLIQSEIQDIGELASVEYLYTDAGKFEDPRQIFGLDVPFTTKSFIAKWDGIIKAGVKMEEIKVEIDSLTKKIIVFMPKAQILSHEIENDSIETLDEKDGLFNPVKVEDVREFDAISKEAMEQRAVENGILDKAYENAVKIIEKLVYNETVKEQGYGIAFETME